MVVWESIPRDRGITVTKGSRYRRGVLHWWRWRGEEEGSRRDGWSWSKEGGYYWFR